jgi:hypothetical protein
MRTQFYIQSGFLSKKQDRKKLENLTNLNKFVQNELDFLNVPTFNTCCDTAGTDPQPVRVNGETGTLETFNGTIWEAVDAGALVSDSITLDDGTVGSLALRIGADTNNGIYGISDTQLGFAVEGVLVGGFNTTGLFTDVISEQTSTVGVTVDGVLLKDGGVTANSMIAAFYPSVVQDNITAGTGGAIPVTNYLTTINTDAGGDAFTLANGTQIGQMKKILLVVDGGGDGVITPTTAFAGGTTATFNDAGDYVILQWSGTAWLVLENSGTTIA